MPRLPIATEDELSALDADAITAELCVEIKPDSFGLYEGRLVAVDYGWGN